MLLNDLLANTHRVGDCLIWDGVIQTTSGGALERRTCRRRVSGEDTSVATG